MVDAVNFTNEDGHRRGCIVKAGLQATVSHINVQGVQCTVIGYARSSYGKVKKSLQNNVGSKNAPKLVSIRDAVTGLAQKGYPLPNMTFHLSERSEGFDKAITAAWSFAADGSQSVEIMLGVNSLYSPDPGREGIAHRLHERGVGNYTTCVVVHEIGHVLHAIRSPDLFFTVGNQMDGANATVALDELNSPYATLNNKETVAETFAAHYFGYPISPKLRKIYDDLGGHPLL